MKYTIPSIFVTILLVVGVFELPYDYYTFLRYIILIYAASFTWLLYDLDIKWAMVFTIALGVLFNPIFPIHLTKPIWVVIDIVSAVIFFIIGIGLYTADKKRQSTQQKNE